MVADWLMSANLLIKTKVEHFYEKSAKSVLNTETKKHVKWFNGTFFCISLVGKHLDTWQIENETFLEEKWEKCAKFIVN